MATPFFIPFLLRLCGPRNDIVTLMAVLNVYMATLYSFIRLKGRPKGTFLSMFSKNETILPLCLIKYLDAKFRYVQLKDETRTFYYDYKDKGKEFNRSVEMECWLVSFSSRIKRHWSYYLVTTISIDKSFAKKGTIEFGQKEFCSAQDLVHLKKAFYGDDENKEDYKGLFYYDNGSKRDIKTWLDRTVEGITGKNPKGHYGRHYLMDICGVNLWQDKPFCWQRRETKEYSHASLKVAFSKAYYTPTAKPYEKVIENYKEFVYGLIYGNENNTVIPPVTLDETLDDSFSNNLSERIFAGHKTEVFLHTHHPYPWKKENTGKKKEINNEPLKNQNVFDIFIVMEAKNRLKHIESTLRQGSPSSIKDALASISAYLSSNPYHLGEYTKRILMLYRKLGVNHLLKSVKEQGNFLADARKIEMENRLNYRVYALTAVTVLIGIFGLIVSIICCNTCDEQSYLSSNMSNLVLDSTCGLVGCCAIVGVLLGLVLAASVIVSCVYQVMSYYKLKDIEGEIRNLQK